MRHLSGPSVHNEEAERGEYWLYLLLLFNLVPDTHSWDGAAPVQG